MKKLLKFLAVGAAIGIVLLAVGVIAALPAALGEGEAGAEPATDMQPPPASACEESFSSAMRSEDSSLYASIASTLEHCTRGEFLAADRKYPELLKRVGGDPGAEKWLDAHCRSGDLPAETQACGSPPKP